MAIIAPAITVSSQDNHVKRCEIVKEGFPSAHFCGKHLYGQLKILLGDEMFTFKQSIAWRMGVYGVNEEVPKLLPGYNSKFTHAIDEKHLGLAQSLEGERQDMDVVVRGNYFFFTREKACSTITSLTCPNWFSRCRRTC